MTWGSADRNSSKKGADLAAVASVCAWALTGLRVGSCGTALADELPESNPLRRSNATEDERAPSATASIEEPTSPTTLPSLTHRDVLLTLDYTGAGFAKGGPSTFTYMAHAGVEVPLGSRHFHTGLGWDVVSAAAEGRGRTVMYGNPEVWVRGASLHESGISAGASFGAVVPLPRALSRDSEIVFDSLRVIRPWDTSYFSSDVGALRPVFDARVLLPPFVIQFRQGLDLLYDFGEDRPDFVARIGTYFGWTPVPLVTLGAEIWQAYSITQEVADFERAAFSFSPSIRLRAAPLEPGLSLMVPMSTPLEGIATSYFAIRFHVEMAIGT